MTGTPSDRFGEKVRQLRRRHDLSQRELAELLGLSSQGYISAVEVGQREHQDAPSLAFALRVARLFGVSLDYLLGDSPVNEDVASHLVRGDEGDGLPQRFGTKLRSLRHGRGWSLSTLARRLGLESRAYLSNLERGVRPLPSIQLIVGIAQLFEVSIDSLLRDDRRIAQQEHRHTGGNHR